MNRYNSLHDALMDLFHAAVVSKCRVSGGDVNEAYELILDNGQTVFMKQNSRKNLPMFQSEINGIRTIEKTGTIQVPRLLGYGVDAHSSFLLMDMIHEGKKIPDFWDQFARELSHMHTYEMSSRFGFYEDNYIGSNKQVNTWCDSWIDFFRDCRLIPQFEQARIYFHEREIQRINKLLDALDDFCVEPAYPSLVHGDLWAGNYMTSVQGRPVLIDPACYFGHFEVDIAMTELFGGYPKAFYTAYKKWHPLQPGYEKRRDIYNLYHLLNHLNLFGESYLSSVLHIISEYV